MARQHKILEEGGRGGQAGMTYSVVRLPAGRQFQTNFSHSLSLDGSETVRESLVPPVHYCRDKIGETKLPGAEYD